MKTISGREASRWGREPSGISSDWSPRHQPTPRAYWQAVAKGAAPGQDIELPPEFTWREYTVFLLTIAAQIEHSLMVQYLYAAYSLGGSKVPPEQRNNVAAWRQVILGIAKEEMGHLATVQNALRFLGAPLALDREDYPWDSRLAPYPFMLEPLTRASLAKYIVAESPETWPADVTALNARKSKPSHRATVESQVNRVGDLYELLIEHRRRSQLLPGALFHPGSYPFQASWDEWARGYGKGARGSSVAGTTSTPDVLVLRMASRTDALAALRAVAEQGEAPGKASAMDAERSHFRRFLEGVQGLPERWLLEPNPAPADNPVAPGLAAGKGQTSITSARAASGPISSICAIACC